MGLFGERTLSSEISKDKLGQEKRVSPNTYYHILVMSMNAGSAQASAAPLSARRAASSAKFLAQACNMRKKPHMKMLTPRHLPIGKR